MRLLRDGNVNSRRRDGSVLAPGRGYAVSPRPSGFVQGSQASTAGRSWGLGAARQLPAAAPVARHRRRWHLLLLASLIASSSGRALADLARAIDCYHSRRYAESRELFRAVEAGRPPDPEIDFHLGRLALWFDEPEEGRRRLERAVASRPADARLRHALGDACGLLAQQAPLVSKLRWARRCREEYERAIALDPGAVEARWSLLGFLAIAPRLAGGSLERARGQAAEIARLDPLEGKIARATLALIEGAPAAAFTEFEDVLRGDPDHFLALYQIGRCAALSGREVGRGIAALRRCLELTPLGGDNRPGHAHVHHRLAELLERDGRTAEAAVSRAAIRRLEPDFRAEKTALRN